MEQLSKTLDEFISHANNAHPTIKFTYEISDSKMSFLDTTSTISDGIISTDLFCKPTDKHQYLSPSSCHPKHCTRSIPYSQALRIRRICSSDDTAAKRLGELRQHLTARGYKKSDIDKGFERASRPSRETLLQYKKKKRNRRIPLVLTYQPSLGGLSQLVRCHWEEVKKHPKLSRIFPEPPICAFRRPKSLRDILVRSSLTPKPKSSVGSCKKCDSRRCLTCKQMLETQTFTSKSTGKTFTIYCNVDCRTANVVYVLQCRCGLQYVGETVQPFNKRMNLHRSDYKCKPDIPVSRHLRSHGHTPDDLSRLSITIIDHNPAWSTSERQARESFWIKTLETRNPYGINEKI